MKEQFIIIYENFTHSVCDYWSGSNPHDGTFKGIQESVQALIEANPEPESIPRISFGEEG